MGNECGHPGTAADATAEEKGRLPSRRPRRLHGQRVPDRASERLAPLRSADPDRDDMRDITAMIEFLRSERPDDV